MVIVATEVNGETPDPRIIAVAEGKPGSRFPPRNRFVAPYGHSLSGEARTVSATGHLCWKPNSGQVYRTATQIVCGT